MIQVDLPMPEACDVCPFNYDFIGCKAINDDAWEKYGDDWNDNVCERTDRPKYCPLKEVDESFAILVLISNGYKVLHETNAIRLVKYKYDQD